MSEASTTTDHETIQAWAEERDGTPATVRGTGDEEHAGLLRIRFSEDSSDDLEEVSWSAFFEKFDAEKLAFLYLDRTADGEVSRFHKFIERS
jgi:hypothetical protein